MDWAVPDSAMSADFTAGRRQALEAPWPLARDAVSRHAICPRRCALPSSARLEPRRRRDHQRRPGDRWLASTLPARPAFRFVKMTPHRPYYISTTVSPPRRLLCPSSSACSATRSRASACPCAPMAGLKSRAKTSSSSPQTSLLCCSANRGLDEKAAAPRRRVTADSNRICRRRCPMQIGHRRDSSGVRAFAESRPQARNAPQPLRARLPARPSRPRLRVMAAPPIRNARADRDAVNTDEAA